MRDEAAERSRLYRRLRDGLGDVGQAFFNFPTLSDVQRAAIPPIAEGRNVLVCAATAAGKTEAVIAPLVWRLRRQGGGAGCGPRLLAVAPTRALVADLVARLETPLAQLGWRCGAQTSDFRGADAEPDVLVTTPESFDSMLVRRLRRDQGQAVGHLLANVAAVFVDEAHCFDSTARGDQVIFLLARLRMLRESAVAKGWVTSAQLQVCAASATVHEPQQLAERLLGPNARAVVCPGSRPMDLLTTDGGWLRLDAGMTAPELVPLLPTAIGHEHIGDLLWAALEGGECRKALVFVPSRRQCDLLGRDLRRIFLERRQIWVETHHGSLSRDHRQRVEKGFHQQRDAVLVATNTLEVGVDIGDVDVVALVGAPPDTSSLLQRIGRGGRRSGLTRLLAIARNPVDAAALASQLVAAVSGQLDARRRFRRWDVFPQQVISYVRQNHGQGRSAEALRELAASAWSGADTPRVAEDILQAWINEGRLVERRGRLHLDGAWEDFAEQSERDCTIHTNICSSPVGREVRHELTGEMLGKVHDLDPAAGTLTVAGRQHRILRQDECIVVVPVADEQTDEREDTPQYRGRRRRVSEAFAAHVRRGCGFDERQAPLVRAGDQFLWFHFGGEIIEAVLTDLFPQFVVSPAIAGVALRVRSCFEADVLTTVDTTKLKRFLDEQGPRVLEDEGLGCFAPHLPGAGQTVMVEDLSLAERVEAWLRSRVVHRAKPVNAYPGLLSLLEVR